MLSASVCTKQGKALVSRQFVEMNRLRVEGLLAAFPKLAGHTSKQHTYVETDSVRYVYQPLENQIYLLLITTKTSNIVEDLGTLRLLAKVVPDIAGGLQEGAINDNAFELIFAFDEVITTGGYKEDVSLSTIRNNLVMDSHEEKIHNALKESKEAQAKSEMKKRADEIKKEQMARLRENFVQGGTGGAAPGGMQGFGGGGGQPQGGQSFMDGFDSGFQEQQQQQQDYAPSGFDPSRFGNSAAEVPSAPKVLAKKGMKLGGMGGAKKDNMMAAMAAEDGFMSLGGGKGGALGDAFGLGAPVQAPVAAPTTPLTLALEEKITAQMNREGGVESCEVKGTLTLTANTDVGALAVVNVNKAQIPSAFNVATHPKVDKKTYEKEGKLMLKGGKAFPVGRGVGILRWSYGDEDAAPLSINCWPEDEGNGTINVNIEMELTRTDLVLQDVNILLPLGTTDPPAIESIDGVYKHDARSGMMCWHFDQIDANTNSTASMEFSISGGDTEAFFPVQVGFRSETLLCPIQIMNVNNSSNGTSVPNQMSKNFAPEVYQIV